MTEEEIDEPNHNLSILLGLIGVMVLAFGGVGWYEDGSLSPLNLYLTVGGLGLLALCVLVAIRMQRRFKRGEKHSGMLERVAAWLMWGFMLFAIIGKLIKAFVSD